MTMDNIMIDIETMGTKSYAAILSIGAVQFDPSTGQIGSQFYKTIDLDSCLSIGLKMEPSTVTWWLEHPAAFLEMRKEEPVSIADALAGLTEFVNKISATPKVWGNSARFDLGLLENAYNALGMEVPWRFYDERDLRTLVMFAPQVKKEVTANGTAHHALKDCLTQIEYCHRIIHMLQQGLSQFGIVVI